mgnify:CR=1 FL=1
MAENLHFRWPIIGGGIEMLQEAIIKGEAAYLKNLTRRKDVSVEEIVEAKESLNNKVRGMKLDRSVELMADPEGKYRI